MLQPARELEFDSINRLESYFLAKGLLYSSYKVTLLQSFDQYCEGLASWLRLFPEGLLDPIWVLRVPLFSSQVLERDHRIPARHLPGCYSPLM